MDCARSGEQDLVADRREKRVSQSRRGSPQTPRHTPAIFPADTSAIERAVAGSTATAAERPGYRPACPRLLSHCPHSRKRRAEKNRPSRGQHQPHQTEANGRGGRKDHGVQERESPAGRATHGQTSETPRLPRRRPDWIINVFSPGNATPVRPSLGFALRSNVWRRQTQVQIIEPQGAGCGHVSACNRPPAQDPWIVGERWKPRRRLSIVK